MEVDLKVHIGSRTFELPLHKNYVSHWGLVQAVREFIQNALDSDSPFVYEFFEEAEGNVALRLTSEFTTLPPSTLLLGNSSKSSTDDKIGSFGEGYKIAMLVLTREGYDVELLNGNAMWKPRFKYSRQYEDELLAIDVTPIQHHKGLEVIIHGLNATEVEEIRASCLKMQEAIGEVKQTRYGDLLLDQPGKLYVGGLFVCATEMRYGYNVKPEYLHLERDRQTVSGWSLKGITLKIWLETGENNRIAKMIEEEVPDLEDAEYGLPELIKDECYKLFKEKHPGKLVARTQDEFKRMVSAGMTNTVVLSGGYGYAVRSSSNYNSEKRGYVEVTPTVILSQWLSRNRGNMRAKAVIAFKELVDKSKGWKF